MKTICLIPARGGSKRIPRKNIRPFLGKPIIEYPIATAMRAGIFNDIIVYTDDHEVRDVAIKAGASYMPRDKVSDNQSTTDMLLEFLNIYKKINKKLEYLCLLYPTSVFITSELLSIDSKLLTWYDGVITFNKYSHPIERAFKIKYDGMSMFSEMRNPEYEFIRTQDIEESYYDAGQMYFLNVKRFLEQKRVFMKNIYPVIINSVDIDNETDWKKAESFYKVIYK